jgi:asparagine synthase (glutamine-hydrolysing)
MCGIAAIVASTTRSETDQAVRAMLRAQAHRGPDDEGFTVLSAGPSSIALGSRRLAILDLSPMGHQPMENPETGDVLVYNGEIYNSPELRSQLQSYGHTFRGHSDTEVLLRAWQQWDVGCLDRLRGMFGFAIWSAREQRMYVARDHLGIKPVYYRSDETGFICASEIRALLASGIVAPAISLRALASYLAYGAVQEPLTILRGVYSLPRASWMAINASGQVVDRGQYWKFPNPEATRQSADSIAADGRALLEKSVQRHLQSDVPVGVFLSSGLDSTAVAALAARTAGHEIHAFTVSFPDDAAYDEAPIARETAKRLGVQYHEYPLGADKVLAWVEDSLPAMDQPSMDGFNTYIVSRAVREQGIVVALSGQGGDEIFGGYNTFVRAPRLHRQLQFAQWMPRAARTGLARLASAGQSPTVRAKLEDIAATGADLAGIYFQLRRVLSNDQLDALALSARGMSLDANMQSESEPAAACGVPGDPVATIARLETAFYLQNVLLRDGDVFGMANSIEIRVPFLDRDVVDWAMRLPGNVLLPSGSPPKMLLRKMCGDCYSKEQLAQSKRGFTPPFALWLQGPLRHLLHESSEVLSGAGLPANGIEEIISGFELHPDSPAWSRAWSLITLAHWITQNHATLAATEASDPAIAYAGR